MASVCFLFVHHSLHNFEALRLVRQLSILMLSLLDAFCGMNQEIFMYTKRTVDDQSYSYSTLNPNKSLQKHQFSESLSLSLFTVVYTFPAASP